MHGLDLCCVREVFKMAYSKNHIAPIVYLRYIDLSHLKGPHVSRA